MHRRTIQINHQPECKNFSVYYPDVCLQLNMFRAFTRPSSGAQLLQWQPLVLPSYRGDSRAVFVVGPGGPNMNTAWLSPRYECKTRGCQLQSLSSWWWAGKRPKHVELWTNVRIINWKIVASGWWFIWIVRWCTDLQTLNFTFKF